MGSEQFDRRITKKQKMAKNMMLFYLKNKPRKSSVFTFHENRSKDFYEFQLQDWYLWRALFDYYF